MSEDREFAEHDVERFIPWFRVLIGVIVSLGLLAAVLTGSGHWVDRSGKVMVAASFLLTFLQFHYENQFAARFASKQRLAEKLVGDKGIPEEEAERIVARSVAELRARFEGVRRRVLLQSLATAGIGEIIAAFGDIAFTAMRQLLCR